MFKEKFKSKTLIGELLVWQKLISVAELKEALNMQKLSQQPLGEVLIDMKAISPEQLEFALAKQQGIDLANPKAATQSRVHQIANRIFSSRCISQADQEVLMSMLLAKGELTLDEERVINRLWDAVQKGLLKAV